MNTRIRPWRMLFVLVVLTIIFGTLWYQGITHQLFSRFSWYDLLLHWLGGFLVGLCSMVFFTFIFSKCQFSSVALVSIAVASAFTISVVWEIGQNYGYISLNREVSLPDVWDTVTDIVMGVIGGTLAGLWVIKKVKY